MWKLREICLVTMHQLLFMFSINMSAVGMGAILTSSFLWCIFTDCQADFFCSAKVSNFFVNVQDSNSLAPIQIGQ